MLLGVGSTVGVDRVPIENGYEKAWDDDTEHNKKVLGEIN